jgi:hypothetical protein
MKTLPEMVGDNILALVPMIDPKPQVLKLLAVEPSGLWIESHEFTQGLMKLLKVQAAPKTAILFIPFHQITLIMASHDSPSLREEAFGV